MAENTPVLDPAEMCDELRRALDMAPLDAPDLEGSLSDLWAEAVGEAQGWQETAIYGRFTS